MKKNILSFVVFILTLLLLLFITIKRDGSDSLSLYVVTEEILVEASKSTQSNYAKRFSTHIEKTDFSGRYYLSDGKKLVIVIEEPAPTIWILDDIKNGGACYLAYGRGQITKLLARKDRVCKNSDEAQRGTAPTSQPTTH